MNKTKAFVRTISLTIIVFCLCGCRENEKYEPPVYPAYSTYVAGSEAAEAAQVWNPFVDGDEDASKKATVIFNGEIYTGSLYYNWPDPSLPYVTERYKGEFNEKTFFFDLNAGNGTLTGLSITDKARPTCSVSHSDCRQIADSVADDYIIVRDYQVEVSVNEEDTLHTYVYYKEFSGYRVDALTVRIDGKGNPVSFQQKYGNFNNVKSVEIDKQKVKDALEVKLNELYGGDDPWIGYEIDREYLVKTKNDQCALLYRVIVELQPWIEDGALHERSDSVNIIILLDYEKINSSK